MTDGDGAWFIVARELDWKAAEIWKEQCLSACLSAVYRLVDRFSWRRISERDIISRARMKKSQHRAINQPPNLARCLVTDTRSDVATSSGETRSKFKKAIFPLSFPRKPSENNLRFLLTFLQRSSVLRNLFDEPYRLQWVIDSFVWT